MVQGVGARLPRGRVAHATAGSNSGAGCAHATPLTDDAAWLAWPGRLVPLLLGARWCSGNAASHYNIIRF